MNPEWFSTGTPHLWRPYAQMKTAAPPLPVVKTLGSAITLADGRTLIDGIASWWTACHGYNHPHIAERVRAQLSTLPHVMLGGLVHEPACALAERLAATLPGSLEHVFFTDSGSVGVEVALKMALQYWMNQGVVEKTRFVAFHGGYHGDTFMTMRVCDPDEGMHHKFSGVISPEHIVALPVDDDSGRAFSQFLKSVAHETAAVIVEPLVQGAGGMRFHDAAVLQRLRSACDAHNVLLIFDEVATGFFRTGTMFAMEQAAVTPDIVVLGKALTGGTLPMAATVASTKIFDAFYDDDSDRALMHGPTFMGNPLAAAAALASLDLFRDEDRSADVARIESFLSGALTRFHDRRNVKDVRVKGAIGVVEMDPGCAPRGPAFVEHGAFIRPIKDVVYLAPALTITDDELAVLVRAMDLAIV